MTSAPQERRKIPRPWLDRLRTPSFQEKKPDVIWETDCDADEWELQDAVPILAATTMTTTPTSQRSFLDSLLEHVKGGFCPPHRSTHSAPPDAPAFIMEPFLMHEAPGTTRCIVSPLQETRRTAPRVIYIVHQADAASPIWSSHKTAATEAIPVQWQQQPASTTPMRRSFDSNMIPADDPLPVPFPVQRTLSLPASNRPPRVLRRSTFTKPPLRPRAPTHDSLSSRHRRSSWEEPWTTESLEQILDSDDSSTIQSTEDCLFGGQQKQERWMMEWAAQPGLQALVEPNHLPTCSFMLREYEPSTILLSGWLAFSPGEEISKRGILPRHIHYLVVLQSERVLYFKTNDTTSGQSSQQEQQPSTTKQLHVPMDAHVEMKLQPQGKAILLKVKEQTLCTLIPVAFPLQQYSTVSVAQHDAALHLLFALDSWIRSSR